MSMPATPKSNGGMPGSYAAGEKKVANLIAKRYTNQQMTEKNIISHIR
jgi:hypothetical protein